MKLSFQDPATNLTESIIELHHGIMFYMIIVLFLVSWMLISIFFDFGYNRYKTSLNLLEDILESRYILNSTKNIVHGEVIEIVWTLTPAFVLVFIGIPSFALLYAIDELIDPALTLKVIGHQWYWSYEYTDILKNKSIDVENFKGISFDSYMISENDLSFGRLRLLEVDKKVWLPIDTHIRVIITATDVLHSWAVPAFGIKMDGVPGRLNQIGLFINRPGLFYGQCSEICGVNHGFMPICVKAVEVNLFNYWCDSQLGLLQDDIVKVEEVKVEEVKAEEIKVEEVKIDVVKVEEKVEEVVMEEKKNIETLKIITEDLKIENNNNIDKNKVVENNNTVDSVKNDVVVVVKSRAEKIQELRNELLKNEIELIKETIENSNSKSENK